MPNESAVFEGRLFEARACTLGRRSMNFTVPATDMQEAAEMALSVCKRYGMELTVLRKTRLGEKRGRKAKVAKRKYTRHPIPTIQCDICGNDVPAKVIRQHKGGHNGARLRWAQKGIKVRLGKGGKYR